MKLLLGLLHCDSVYLDRPQVVYWHMLRHQNRALSISTRTSSGLRAHIMALICVLWLPMKSATPLAWVTLSSEAL